MAALGRKQTVGGLHLLEASRRQKVRRLTAYPSCYPGKVQQGYIALAALDLSHVAAVNASRVRQGFL